MEIQPSKLCGVGFAPTVPDLGKPVSVELIQHLVTWLTSANIS